MPKGNLAFYSTCGTVAAKGGATMGVLGTWLEIPKAVIEAAKALKLILGWIRKRKSRIVLLTATDIDELIKREKAKIDAGERNLDRLLRLILHQHFRWTIRDRQLLKSQ